MQNTGTIIAIVLVVVFAILLLGGAGMMGGGITGGMMNGGMMGVDGFGFNPLGGILSLVFGALVIGDVVLLVVSLTRNAGRSSSSMASSESPLEILKVHYARVKS